jgi:hypothetical protein
MGISLSADAFKEGNGLFDPSIQKDIIRALLVQGTAAAMPTRCR